MPKVFNRASSASVSGFPPEDCGNDGLNFWIPAGVYPVLDAGQE